MAITALLGMIAAAGSPARGADAPFDDSYAVVVSQATAAADGWRDVVVALRDKYDATVIEYDGDVRSARDALAELFPRYACFVATPEETGRSFVTAVHRMTRSLDDDPYTDVRWGIITGYSSADALRIATAEGPLIIRKGAAGVAIPLEHFDEGVWFDECQAGRYHEKIAAGTIESKTCDADTTARLVDAFNQFHTDFFMTSGHATERDWQIGYTYPNGQFRCEHGVLFGLDLKGNRYDINSPNPKVYLAAGNCLMGHVKDRESMALAFMGSGGVNQLVGYTVATWFGSAGWGTRDYFFSPPGQYTFHDTWFYAQQLLLDELHRKHPKTADLAISAFDQNGMDAFFDAVASAGGYEDRDEVFYEHAGLLWDRDAVAFYGDPAWEARLADHGQGWTESITVNSDGITIRLHAASNAQLKKPPALALPIRMTRPRINTGEEYWPLVTDDFVILRAITTMRKGETYELILVEDAPEQQEAAPSPKEDAIEWPAVMEAITLLPDVYLPDVIKAIGAAEANAGELVEAIHAVAPEHREGLAFLLANMPQRDLTTLTGEFLAKNVELAYQARSEAPWGADVPDDIFLNDVLPYVNLNERRDDWRQDFHDRFIDAAKACGTIEATVADLNKRVYETFDVTYHPTKRHKPDQSPYETIVLHYASCTGLSIILTDALRSVCIPARVAGTPLWVNRSGNHSWVEVWDGEWYFIGAAEPAPYNTTWFNGVAAEADPTKPEHCIYAASFKRTGLPFPLVWAPQIDYVYAIDVTERYAAPSKEEEPAEE
ncbi:MAG: transglutaminase domain-containing protein [Phycisphaerales bacterium]|nr:transglutaminase domain-containing protein [Phycisphaerales bacterium]